MVERGGGRIVIIGSGGSYLPVRNATISSDAAYGASKAALGRFGEIAGGERSSRSGSPSS